MERLGCIATNQNMFRERRSKRGLTCGTFFSSAGSSQIFSPVGEPKILSNLPARLVLALLVGTWQLQVYLDSTRSLCKLWDQSALNTAHIQFEQL
jgi:hypothetical protein